MTDKCRATFVAISDIKSLHASKNEIPGRVNLACNPTVSNKEYGEVTVMMDFDSQQAADAFVEAINQISQKADIPAAA